MTKQTSGLERVLSTQGDEILADWMRRLTEKGSEVRLSEREQEAQCRSTLAALREAVAEGTAGRAALGERGQLHELATEIARGRATQGFSARDTATFIFSLKSPLFSAIGRAMARNAAAALSETLAASDLLDDLGLFIMEEYQKTRETLIVRQQQEITELSTPVVKLWQGVLAVPLIGTLDSARTQVVMENLLQAIVDQAAEIAIIDITGVPTVDTLVAQHLLKTVAAARLMGADCVISGIRPQIAQTMVHLGIELTVVSKATLADALAYALAKIGKTVVSARMAAPRDDAGRGG